MPNDCSNTLTLIALDKKKLEEIKNKYCVKSGDDDKSLKLDFNKIIPIPENKEDYP